MEMRHRYDQAKAILDAAERIAVVAHAKPDGDSLGAACGMLRHLRSQGKAVEGFCVDPVPEQYCYLTESERFHTDQAVLMMADVVVVFDAGDLRFAGIEAILAARTDRPVVLDVDHHVTNELFGDVNIVDPGASSTAEVVYDYLAHVKAPIDRAMATALLTGIVFDTGNFTNPATTVRSLEVAAVLLNAGARLTEISGNITKNKPVDALRAWGDVFSRLKFDTRFGIASTAIFLKDVDAHRIDAEHVSGISNFLNRFLDVDIVMVLKELPDGKVNGSLRSAADVDVAPIATALGGGGHKKAAGFTVPGRIEEMEAGWRIAR